MFTEQQRLIFGPFDRGDGSPAYADPLRVRRKLNNLLDGDYQKVWERAAKKDIPELADEATDRLHAAAVSAFGLVPFDPATGMGATEDQIVAVLNQWAQWEEETKDFFGNSPTPAEFTAPAFSGGDPTTAPFAGSTSTCPG